MRCEGSASYKTPSTRKRDGRGRREDAPAVGAGGRGRRRGRPPVGARRPSIRPDKAEMSGRPQARAVNDLTIGRALRVLRHRAGLRQADVAKRAGVSQQLVSKVERGRSGHLTGRTLRRIFAGVDADVVTFVRWRGGELDRLLDEGHPNLVGAIVTFLRRRGWDVLTEVTYSDFGERGSIDVLAWHPGRRVLPVVEVKTEITSSEELLRRHDAKVRLGPKIARDRFGSTPTSVARLLVLGETQANRNRFARLGDVLSSAYPSIPRDVRGWLSDPVDRLVGGVLFLSPARSAPTTSRGRIGRAVSRG
jgi:transcriptional regulator with XRE-family HTH domain